MVAAFGLQRLECLLKTANVELVSWQKVDAGLVTPAESQKS